jgi:hypothetical protein
MKIPLAYPKIPDTTNCPLKKCVVFEKLDGTNLHFSWYDGWQSFGTRRTDYSLDKDGIKEFYTDHPELDGASSLFDKSGSLDRFLVFHKNYGCNRKIILFAEYFGSNSFAGMHKYEDEKQLVYFDVMVDGVMIPSEQFIKDFSQFNIAKVIYKGKYSGQLVEDIRNGKYNVNEGAVIKGVANGKVYMAKVKTNVYMDKLKAVYKDNWKDYWE